MSGDDSLQSAYATVRLSEERLRLLTRSTLFPHRLLLLLSLLFSISAKDARLLRRHLSGRMTVRIKDHSLPCVCGCVCVCLLDQAEFLSFVLYFCRLVECFSSLAHFPHIGS